MLPATQDVSAPPTRARPRSANERLQCTSCEASRTRAPGCATLLPVSTSPHAFERVLRRIDALHAEDPTVVAGPDGAPVAKELRYATRMTYWLGRLVEVPSPELAIAVRAQHLRRWTMPRTDYPEGRAGYLRWRSDAAAAHARLVGEILAEESFDPAFVERVRALVRKRDLSTDPEAQALEDAASLTFLELDAANFVAARPDLDASDLLTKVHAKMSPQARALAHKLSSR